MSKAPHTYTLHNSAASAPAIDYASVLNPQQLEVVTSNPGHALVISGAGSGKTHTLTHRVAYLMEQGISTQQILLLTFTNKAAKEMLSRVEGLLGCDISPLWGGTFHSICHRLLRRHGELIGLSRNFTILDGDDQKKLIKDLISQHPEAAVIKKESYFPSPKVLLSMINLSTNQQVEFESLLEDSYPQFESYHEHLKDLYRDYFNYKQDQQNLDFDDLLLKSIELFEKQPDLQQQYQQRFRFVLIDEYQDTNQLQSAWIKSIVGDGQSLMVVGDDAQSIYSWRGANIEHILNFEKNHNQAKTFRIEQNYRSSPEILALANHVINLNPSNFKKNLEATCPSINHLPEVIALAHPSQQAQFVLQKIQDAMTNGTDLSQIAVLYRSHHHSLEIQLNLVKADIPFVITSGIRFFEQAHVKDVLAGLKLMINPRDELSFKRLVSLLPGIGEKSAQKLWQTWKTNMLPLYLGNWSQLNQHFKASLLNFPTPKKSQQMWEDLCHTLDELILSNGLATPSQMIFSMSEGFYADYLNNTFDNATQRQQDLTALGNYAQNAQDTAEWLSELSLLSELEESTKNNQSAHSSAITLSSIHQAKGLEWEQVFLIGLNEGAFPSRHIVESESQSALEEERRLFYVAITRAKKHLHLCYCQYNPKNYSGDFNLEPSRFVEEINPDLIQYITIKNY